MNAFEMPPAASTKKLFRTKGDVSTHNLVPQRGFE
jgi:hypothetical protein